MSTALLLIDLQNDFCPGGALAVQEGDQVIAVANQAIEVCRRRGWPVVASQDWHPASHRSFATHSGEAPGTLGTLEGLPQVWWPEHCIQDQPGADFHPDLNLAGIDQVFRKGQNPDVDSYSAFFDNGRRTETELDSWLKGKGITTLVVMGLATDYCVKYSVLDALALGYTTSLITEGCRGVNLQPDDSERAFEEMQQQGAHLIALKSFEMGAH